MQRIGLIFHRKVNLGSRLNRNGGNRNQPRLLFGADRFDHRLAFRLRHAADDQPVMMIPAFCKAIASSVLPRRSM